MKKYAVVTGGSGQLGKSFIKTLIENNYYVYSIDIRDSDVKHKRVENIKLDITDDKAVKKFYKDLKHVDLLINNAGIGVYTPTLKRTKKEFFRSCECKFIRNIFDVAKCNQEND